MTAARPVFLALILLLPGHAGAEGIDQRLQQLLGSASSGEADQFLPPDQAFAFSAQSVSPQQLRLGWQIADGYYLYREQFAVRSAEAMLGQWSPPPGRLKADAAFGEVEVNTGHTQFTVPLLSRPADAVRLAVRYQGCKEDAICYPPIEKTVSVTLMDSPMGDPADRPADDVAGVLTDAPAANPTARPPATAPAAASMQTATLSAQDQITQTLKSSGLLANIIAFFIFGLLLSLTPCVFPMIPILSGIIVGQPGRLSVPRGLVLSFAYVLAMALSYAVLGVVAGALQLNIQAAAQSPWAISLFSAVFVLLALSMFGLYELQLPVAMQTRLAALANSQASSQIGGGLPGVALMGALSAVIVGPCVAPPLAGALLYISQTGNAVLGGIALFFMGLGLGVPLLLIGASAGSLLPRAGPWMQGIKSAFGVLMLAVAIWLLERIIPMPLALLLWGGLFIVSALYLGAFEAGRAAGWQRLIKGAGLLMMIYGLSLMVGALAGADDKFRPLRPFTAAQVDDKPVFKRVHTLAELQQALRYARAGGDAVMLDFYADWCVTCIEMERHTFSQAEARREMERFVLLQADVTANSADDRQLLARFGLFGPPAIIFFDGQGAPMRRFSLVGFVAADAFAQHLRAVQEALL